MSARRIAGVALAVSLLFAGSPAAAQREKVFAGIVPDPFLKKWSANLWVVIASPTS